MQKRILLRTYYKRVKKKNATILPPLRQISKTNVSKKLCRRPLFTKGRGKKLPWNKSHWQFNQKKKITIYYSCCFSRAGKKLDRGSQICIWVLYLPIITIWIPKVPLFNEIWCYTDMTDSLNTLFFFFFCISTLNWRCSRHLGCQSKQDRGDLCFCEIQMWVSRRAGNKQANAWTTVNGWLSC